MSSAKDGYFYAKREMVAAIDRRIKILFERRQEFDLNKSYYQMGREKSLEELRDFIRNVMLWHEADFNEYMKTGKVK